MVWGQTQLLLCLLVAVFLAMPHCDAAAPSLRSTGTRYLLATTSANGAMLEESKIGDDKVVPTSPLENKNESNVWTHFQEQEVSVDYTPSGANPDPGMPPPIGA
ncbi:uncharacterized protein [Physcomitrium patens]|uniref:Uncharacterized protein n=2 Tax=Physcomitrium patens TaxID=3218 RepID=A9THQ0_PHYPA|nr:uncharacterized protein LOC112277521 [Physcomitrium patens]|eukprot:XP_024365735.1 uncharacterized protein LOC112277521 [Physcomitrella patens]